MLPLLIFDAPVVPKDVDETNEAADKMFKDLLEKAERYISASLFYCLESGAGFSYSEIIPHRTPLMSA